MKTTLIALLILFFSSIGIAQQQLDYPFSRVEEYVNNQQGTIFLETDFGGSRILSKKELSKLKERQIFHIDLVYTKYRENPEFDQQQLNKDRIAGLTKLIPQIALDDPTWKVYEQTGATTRKDAKGYFHGFVIHYGKSIEYADQKKYLDGLTNQFGVVGIDNQVGGTAKYYTGSVIQMEKNTVYHQNGELVQGYYQLHYREFRDQADIALSGIPMFYHGNGADEIFNSAGMFEIRAFKDGEELVLQSPAQVNFQCTEVLEDANFYQMNEDGEWTEEASIVPTANSSSVNTRLDSVYSVVKGTVGAKMAFQKYVPEDEIDQGAYQGQTRITRIPGNDRDQLKVYLNEAELRRFRKGIEGTNSRLNEMSEDLDTQGVVKSVLVFAKDSVEFIEYMTGRKFQELVRTTRASPSPGEEDFTIYQTAIYGTKVDTILTLVRNPVMPAVAGFIYGMNVKNFGVYNCDQTRRLKSPIAVSPVYYDSETNEKLVELYMTCVIDMTINASLSYIPNKLFCSEEGKTKLVIFSNDNQVYFMDQPQLSKVDLAQENVELKVTNVSDKVSSPSDLRMLLEL